jgi:DegV family protein with EDD domain
MSPPPRVGLCTDSNAQLPPSLVERFGVEVVPITITMDHDDYLEGSDLDADSFYARFSDEHRPDVTTSPPSPGQFALAYEQLLDRGCTEILSVHVTSAIAGVLKSARLAAHRVDTPVRLVDSGTAGFGVGCCVWAAGEALERGATLDEAAAVAEALSPTIGNVFVVGSLDRLRSTGRLPAGPTSIAIPVLALNRGVVEVIAEVDTMVDAVNSMAAEVVSRGRHLHVAVGHGDAATASIADALEAAVGESATVDELVRYRVGPSIGANTGPGTVACFAFTTTATAPSTRAAS